MTRSRVFLDTGVLLAAVLPRDPDRREAVEILHAVGRKEYISAHTSDYVVAEALNFVRMKVRRLETAETLLALVFGTDATPPVVASVLRIHGGRFARALELYRTEFRRGLSLTDWTSVVAARDAGIADVATFDAALRSAFRDQTRRS